MVETNKANFWRKWKGSGSAVIPVYQDDLRDAICDNNLLAVQEIIQENPDCLKWLQETSKWRPGQQVWGWPSAPLHHAAADDRPEIVKYLIQDVGMDANGILRLNQGEKVAAIHLAILEGNTETVEKLVELGAGLTVKGEFNLNRGTPLEWAERCQKNKQLSKFARSNYDPFKPMVNLLREQVSDSRTRK